MAKSWFTSQKDAALAAGSANFSTLISAQPTSYGLVAAQATSYASVNSVWQAAYAAASNPGSRTRSLVAAKNSARDAMCFAASNLAKVISATSTVTDAQRESLGLSVRPIPTPRPAPGTPAELKTQLNAGALHMSWKCENPKGSSGTIYQIYRKVGAGAFVYLGGSGEKKFTDAAIPAGATLLTYKIQAVRSTAVGLWGEFVVSFGALENGVAPETIAALKLAA